MGRMKELYTLLQETEQALREYDPLAFENAKQIVEAAQAMALASLTPRPRSIKPREDQTYIPQCDYCGRINTENNSRIGAKRDEDNGFTVMEGTGKMTCQNCYAIAREEAENAMA
jgi:hypothetical protein